MNHLKGGLGFYVIMSVVNFSPPQSEQALPTP